MWKLHWFYGLLTTTFMRLSLLFLQAHSFSVHLPWSQLSLGISAKSKKMNKWLKTWKLSNLSRPGRRNWIKQYLKPCIQSRQFPVSVWVIRKKKKPLQKQKPNSWFPQKLSAKNNKKTIFDQPSANKSLLEALIIMKIMKISLKMPNLVLKSIPSINLKAT